MLRQQNEMEIISFILFARRVKIGLQAIFLLSNIAINTAEIKIFYFTFLQLSFLKKRCISCSLCGDDFALGIQMLFMSMIINIPAYYHLAAIHSSDEISLPNFDNPRSHFTARSSYFYNYIF